jgi:DinB superfamily
MAGGPLALTPEIDDLRRQFESVSKAADALVTPLRDDQFTWRPEPNAWSIAECLDHLNATARLYLPMLDEGIADAIRRGVYGNGPFRYSWVGRIMVRTAEPPPRIRVRSPHAFHPASNRSRHEVMAALRAYQVQYIDRLRQANGLDLARARVSSPVSKWLRLSLGSGFALMAAHERRHLWQARKISETPGFPV